jgi:hypothetical protein
MLRWPQFVGGRGKINMKLEELAEKTSAVIELMCSEETAKRMNDLLDFIGVDNYFTAPASSKDSFHNSFPSGLAEHNLNVLTNLIALNEAGEMGFSDEDMCVVALLHDIGKVVNTDNNPFYVPQTEKWKKERGENYEYDYGSVYFPTNLRTMYVLQSAGFKLTATQYQAILLNDGMYLDGNKIFMYRQTDLSILLHQADHLASMKEKKKEKPDKK